MASMGVARVIKLAVVGGIGLAVLTITGSALAYASFKSEMRQHSQRLEGRSQLASTRFGRVEFAERGGGPPFLMIHGTGGGFDQALTFTQALSGYRVIAPSRFGYLRSAFPADPSSARQADALAEMLDRLDIEALPVAGGSAGALSAVQFALRYPERTSALILIVPAANVSGRDPVEMGAEKEFLVRRLASSDFLFWSATKMARRQLVETLLATDPDLVEQAPKSEQARARRILDEIMPVSRRWRGMLNDGRLAGSPADVDFSRITVPTLVISVEDDLFGTASTARSIATQIASAELVIFRRGGHIWLGHDEELWRAVSDFVQANNPAKHDLRASLGPGDSRAP